MGYLKILKSLFFFFYLSGSTLNESLGQVPLDTGE